MRVHRWTSSKSVARATRGHLVRHLRRMVALATLSVCYLALAAAGGAETFFATIKNESRGTPECLIFGGNGQLTNPDRFNWGAGDYCGLDGGKDELFTNLQALWTFESLGNDEYLIKNSSRGREECLIFNGNGNDTYPERYRWGAGPFCGLDGGKDAILANRQAVWKLTDLGSDRYMITNDSGGTEECLIFGGNGSNQHPERYNWGPGPYCGYSGGVSALLANKQAIFHIQKLRLDDFPIPQEWLDGYLLLQSFLISNQRLMAKDDGSGQVEGDWGDDHAFRWSVEPSGDGNFFTLRNALTQKRLHVGHDGDGKIYSGWGDDAAYQWSAEPHPTLESYFFRNKLYPDQRLTIAQDGQGQLTGAWPVNFAFSMWDIQVLPTLSSPADNTFILSQFYGRIFPTFFLQNELHPDQRLRVDRNGSGQIYAQWGDDLSYRWRITRTTAASHFFLENSLHSNQRLHVGHNGDGRVYAGTGNDDAYLWSLEPLPGRRFFLRNKLHSNQRVHVGHNGNQEAYAAWGDDDAFRWNLRIAPYGSWQTANPGCVEPDSLSHRAYKLCLYPWLDQVGPPYCVVHHDKYPNTLDTFLGNLPSQVAEHARSVKTQDCGPNGSDPVAFIYDERDQQSDTDVIFGSGNLGGVTGRANSYRLGDFGRHVCLYAEEGFKGRRHCVPYHPDEPSFNLSADLNNQIHSVQASPHWICLEVALWQQQNEGGQSIAVGSSENLKNRLIFIDGEFLKWTEFVSSFQLRRPAAVSFCS